MKENVNKVPEPADDASLARSLFEGGILDEEDLEVEAITPADPINLLLGEALGS